MGKISKKSFYQFVDGQSLVLTGDHFINNGCWAVRKDIFDNVLSKSKIDYKAKEGSIRIIDLVTQDFMFGQGFLDGLLARVEKEICYYDNVKFKENGKYLIIEELNGYGIKKVYYNGIKKFIGRKAKAKILQIDYVLYYKKDGQITKIKNEKFVWLCWIEDNVDDLSKLLAICPVQKIN